MQIQGLKKSPQSPYQWLDFLPQGMLLVDESGQIDTVNAFLLNDLGYAREEITRKKIFEINPRYSLLGWRKKWRRLQAGEVIQLDSELLTSRGILYPVHTTLCMLPFGAQPLCCIVVENLLAANRYKDLLELTAKMVRIGNWEYDLVSETVLITRELNLLLGRSEEEELLSREEFLTVLTEILEPDSVQQVICESKHAVQQGAKFELDVFQKDHSQAFLLKGIALESEGITSKLFGTLQDISSIAERSEEMYMAQFTLDCALEMIFWVQPDYSLSYVNQTACQQLGYEKAHLLRTNIGDLFPDLAALDWADLWEQLRSQKTLRQTLLLRHQDGRLTEKSTQLHYLSYKGSEFICLFVGQQDFQGAQNEFLDLIYHTLNQSNDLIFWVRPDRSLVYFNDPACSYLGYERSEMEALSIQDIYGEYTFFEEWERLREAREWQFEHLIRCKDGSQIPTEAVITLVQFRGEECACITYREISELRKKERKLEEALQEIELLREKLKEEKTYLRGEVAERYSFNHIITGSEKYKQVLRQVAQVATTDATVLILGETGTGKELLARSIHQLSEREDEVLVKVNCAALPENLVESELFGHEKGAFTGAYQRKLGRFELADQGTLFLDEVGELPLELQAKLLRVLQEGEFERLGSNVTQKVDVRVIAATNRKLEQLVEEGRFREDLYYRLNVFPIRNLPLRERLEDVPLLVQHFVGKFCKKTGRKMPKIPKSAVKELSKYYFPGNVRELENIVERALILSPGDRLNLEATFERLKAKSRRRKKKQQFYSFEEMQRQHIIDALERTNWKVTGTNSASELLQINGKTLASKMRKFDIQRPNSFPE